MNVDKFFRVHKQKRDVGVEIEVEGHSLYKGHLDYWYVEHDGSLRGEDNAEYVLREPLSQEGLKEALLEINKTFELHKAEVDMSRRTSTHVHINCTQLSMIELFNFITLLLIFEESLVDWCGDERNGNLFCLQSKDAEGMLQNLKKFAKGKEKGHLADDIRYSAINLAALNKYGTVELRSLEGTLDTTRILTWVGVLLQLREVAKTFENPMDIISNLSLEAPRAFSKRMLGKYTKFLFVGKKRIRKVLDGARRAQDIAYTVDWEIWNREEKPRFEEEVGRVQGLEVEEIVKMREAFDEAPVPMEDRIVKFPEGIDRVMIMDEAGIAIPPPVPNRFKVEFE